MFNNKELDTKVKFKLGIFDGREPSENELENVKDIFLSNLNVRGEKINTDLSELVKLKNLKSLDLKGFYLIPEVLDVIGNMKELEGIKLYECSSDKPISIDLEQLRSLILDTCDVQFQNKINSLESLLVVNCGMVDVLKLPLGKNIKELGIKNSEIINSEELTKIENLKSLNVDGSVLDNEDVLKTLLANKIAVSHEQEYHPIK